VKGSPADNGFLWWEGFMKNVGFESAIKRDGVMDDDRGEDDVG